MPSVADVLDDLNSYLEELADSEEKAVPELQALVAHTRISRKRALTDKEKEERQKEILRQMPLQARLSKAQLHLSFCRAGPRAHRYVRSLLQTRAAFSIRSNL